MRKLGTSSPWIDSLEEPSIQLTPLIDVLFVILIAFIAAAPLLEYERVDLVSSQGPSEPLPMENFISLSVHSDDAIFLRGRKILASELPLYLQQIKKQNPSAKLQLFHDKSASFGTYYRVKQAAERAGFREMELILDHG